MEGVGGGCLGKYSAKEVSNKREAERCGKSGRGYESGRTRFPGELFKGSPFSLREQ